MHLAFMHSPSQIPFWRRMGVFFGGLPSGIAGRFLKVAAEADQRAIDTFGAALKGSERPQVTTFGTMGLSHVGFRATKPATEEDEPDPLSPGIARAKTEENVEALASLGVRTTMVRLAPSVHGDGDTGLVPQLISTPIRRVIAPSPPPSVRSLIGSVGWVAPGAEANQESSAGKMPTRIRRRSLPVVAEALTSGEASSRK